MPPGTPRSRSLTRFTTRVGLPHLGQSVDFVVSITFLRTHVFAILAIGWVFILLRGVSAHTRKITARGFNGAGVAAFHGIGITRKERDSLQTVYIKAGRRLAEQDHWRPLAGQLRPARRLAQSLACGSVGSIRA